jgi:hypothetical protein
MNVWVAAAIGIAGGYVLGNIVGIVLYVWGVESGYLVADSMGAMVLSSLVVLTFSAVGGVLGWYFVN